MTADMDLAAGFADPVLDGQQAFRAVMTAMSRPASLQALPGVENAPAPLSPAAAAVVLALADHETPLWLDRPLTEVAPLRRWLAFHCGAPIVEAPSDAVFAVVAEPAAMPALEAFSQGSDAYPDRSTTLILQVESFMQEGSVVSGPGVAAPTRFAASPLPTDFWTQWQANRGRYPRGVDVILAGPDAVACLPRSLVLEAA